MVFFLTTSIPISVDDRYYLRPVSSKTYQLPKRLHWNSKLYCCCIKSRLSPIVFTAWKYKKTKTYINLLHCLIRSVEWWLAGLLVTYLCKSVTFALGLQWYPLISWVLSFVSKPFRSNLSNLFCYILISGVCFNLT